MSTSHSKDWIAGTHRCHGLTGHFVIDINDRVGYDTESLVVLLATVPTLSRDFH